MKYHQIKESLSAIAPSVRVRLHWEHDTDNAWIAVVTADTVQCGELVRGAAYLGGADEKDPSVHGYLPGMVGDALVELRGECSLVDWRVKKQIVRALDWLASVAE